MRHYWLSKFRRAWQLFELLPCTGTEKYITEFNYRYANAEDAHVFAGVELSKGEQEREALVSHLQQKGYKVFDLTDNETAKLHIRYMVGGHPLSAG